MSDVPTRYVKTLHEFDNFECPPHRAGPVPLFPQEERLHSSARPRGKHQDHRGETTGRDSGFVSVPSRLFSEPVRIPRPPAEKSVSGDKVLSATSTGFVAPYSGTGSAESLRMGDFGAPGENKEEENKETKKVRINDRTVIT